jgi:hypothetical protein
MLVNSKRVCEEVGVANCEVLILLQELSAGTEDNYENS